jgi:hypothetical protein
MRIISKDSGCSERLGDDLLKVADGRKQKELDKQRRKDETKRPWAQP